MNEPSPESSITPTQPTPEPASQEPAGAGSSSLQSYGRPNLLQGKERRDRVWQLRIVERKAYGEIARELCVSTETVKKDLKIELNKNQDPALAEKVQKEQLSIYESLIDKWLPVALDADMETIDGSLAATDKVVKVMSEQAKLLGLGQDTKGKGVSASELGKEFGKRMADAVLMIAQMREGKVIDAEIVTPQLEDKNT